MQDAFGRYQSQPSGAQLSRSGIVVAARGPVAAVADGIVSFAGLVPAVGEVVIVEHSPFFATVYGDLRRPSAHAGKVVHAGDILGEAAGAYGFEVRRGVMPEDPLPWLSR